MCFREFKFPEAMRLWDNIFAYYLHSGFKSIDLLDYFVCAMMKYVKSGLMLEIDPTNAVAIIMKFPSVPSIFTLIEAAYEYEGTPHILIVRDFQPGQGTAQGRDPRSRDEAQGSQSPRQSQQVLLCQSW